MNAWTIVAGVCAACALLGWIEAIRIHRIDERRGVLYADRVLSACDDSATLHDYALMLQDQASHAQEHFEEDSKQMHTLVDELHSVTEERNALKTALDKEIQRARDVAAPADATRAPVTPRTPGKGIPPKRPSNTPRATLKSRASDMAAGSDGGRA